MIVVPVLMTSCQVSEKPKKGPLTPPDENEYDGRYKGDRLARPGRDRAGEYVEDVVVFVLARHVVCTRCGWCRTTCKARERSFGR